jgi:hypothetical protein
MQDIVPYLPKVLNVLFPHSPTRKKSVHVKSLQGVVLFLDMSGFTRLTELLAKEGNIGCEKVSDILNDNFSKLINIIVKYKGTGSHH